MIQPLICSAKYEEVTNVNWQGRTIIKIIYVLSCTLLQDIYEFYIYRARECVFVLQIYQVDHFN